MTAQNGGVHVEGWLMHYGMTVAGPYQEDSRFTAGFSVDGNVVQSVGERYTRH
jgi:hypothetical protein